MTTVVSYEDRADAMDSLILMAESLCRADPDISLHLTVPHAPREVRAWAERAGRVALSPIAPPETGGWDVKPLLLLEQLNAGRQDALWLDSDMIITRPVSEILRELPRDILLVAQEWNRPEAMEVSRLWGLASARAVAPVNSCFVRVTQAHRPLLQRWLEMMRDPRYREAQALPFDARPFHLASDQVLLTALLGSEAFGRLPFDYIRLGRHIAQCAGSSGYRPHDRVLDLWRGLPPIIHCIGRKPWSGSNSHGAVQRYMTDLATDVSPYVLAARRVARTLGISPRWLNARTSLGALLRMVSGSHPGLAGLPLAVAHAAGTGLARRR